MFLQLDIREQDLISSIMNLIENIPSFKDIELKKENLPLGDIIIGNEKENFVIIERKSINDLMASIKDGRYEEQSYRLTNLNHPNHNIIYLIEGDINKINRFKDNRMDKLTLYSAIFSLNYTKGFSVIRTFSLEESAIFICNSLVKLKKNVTENKKPYFSNIDTLDTNNSDSNECSDKNYISVVKKVKKDNITPDNIAEIMLCNIPGISTVTALAIMKNYTSLDDLILNLKENNDCLNNISYETEKGQIRKINKTCTENIIKYLLKKNIENI
jgi:ERCC4-type nuclease